MSEKLPIFFASPENIKEDENKIFIYGKEAKHIVKSLRYKINDQILISDGKGNQYLTSLEEYKDKALKCRIIRSIRKEKKEKKCEIVLAQSILKGEKMDWLTQKSTELGINSIIPFISKRTIPLLTPQDYEKKRKRWQRIAYEASKQSQRSTIPEIQSIITLDDLLSNYLYSYDLSLIFWENERLTTLKDIISTSPMPHRILYLIGPEGGFSEEEINLAQKHSLKSISLGNSCLRSETAAIFVLSILKYFYHL